MGSSTRVKSPCVPEVAVRLNPVSSCVTVTAAAETVAPLGSQTVPRITPVTCCELPEPAINPASRHANSVLNANLIEITLPLSAAVDRSPPASRHECAESFALPRRKLLELRDYPQAIQIAQ